MTAVVPMADARAARSRERVAAAIPDAIAKALREPMRWGVDDCALWVADIIEAALGTDPAKPFRGRYSTPRGYVRVLRREGFHSLEQVLDAVAHARGWRRIWPDQAKTGDIGLAEVKGEGARQVQACLIRRGGLWMGRRNYGVGYVPTSEIISAWRVA